MKLNKSYDTLGDEVKSQKLKKIMGDFYDGLIQDLLSQKSYPLAQVVYGEKLRDKFEKTVKDQLIGLEIFGAQKNFAEYCEVFNELLGENSTSVVD